MHVHDPDALSLEIVARGDEKTEREREQDQRRSAPAQPGSKRTSDLQEAGRVSESVHGGIRSSRARARGKDLSRHGKTGGNDVSRFGAASVGGGKGGGGGKRGGG